MTDLTSTVHEILREKKQDISQQRMTHGEAGNVNEFLKEAYRINSHIQSLLHYLQSIRHSYLSITSGGSSSSKRNIKDNRPTTTATATATRTTTSAGSFLTPIGHIFTDADRDSIDSSTALLLRDLSASIGNLQSAEKLRQETERTLLNKKYGHGAGGVLWRWAAGDTSTNRQHDGERDGDGGVISHKGKSEEQIMAEETARAVRTVRENVLWYLRRNLEQTAEVQRAMVEKRIERVREKEKSVLYKSAAGIPPTPALSQPQLERAQQQQQQKDSVERNRRQQREYEKTSTLSAEEAASIESQLSPEQLQLFAEENNLMLRHYEETLSKVQNAEKSLLEISSLQQTLVSHLATQEEYISQLVGDASSTAENVGKGNKELKRASERRSTAQLVFWCTTGLCLWLVVWDAIF